MAKKAEAEGVNLENVNGDCVVGLMMPHGLILRLFDMIEAEEPQRDGSTKTIKKAEVRQETIKLEGYLERYKIANPLVSKMSKFAFTEDVSTEFMKVWFEQNKDLDLVKNGLVFAAPDLRSAKAMAREREALKCGLEPLDPSNLPKGFKEIKTYAQNEAA